MRHALKIELLIAGLAFGGSLAACAATPTSESTSADVDDAVLTAKVKAAIMADDTLKIFDIHVATKHDVVELSGFVDSGAAIDQATSIAAKVPGVRAVLNGLFI